jgi:hypothetical protein
MQELDEIVQTMERLQDALETIILRGIRSSTSQQLAILSGLQEEFERIGAGHLASRIFAIVTAIKSDDPGSAGKIFQALASLRVFERVLTLEFAEAALAGVLALQQSGEKA